MPSGLLLHCSTPYLSGDVPQVSWRNYRLVFPYVQLSVSRGSRSGDFGNNAAEPSPACWEARHPLRYSADGASAAGGGRGNRRCYFGNHPLRAQSLSPGLDRGFGAFFALHFHPAWCTPAYIASASKIAFSRLRCGKSSGSAARRYQNTCILPALLRRCPSAKRLL